CLPGRSGPFDPIILDHGIGEQLRTHGVEIGVADIVGDIELDEAAGAHVAHAAEAQSLQRVMDRLALRVENPWLERHIDLDFHEANLCERVRGRWARLCPRITLWARVTPFKISFSRIANRSHLSCCESVALS